jgi:hypothetical protein
MKEEFNYGELVEVRDYNTQEWLKRVWVGTLPHTKGCWCMRGGQDITNYDGWAESWVQMRKIQKPEPDLIDIQTGWQGIDIQQPEHIEQRMDKFEANFNSAIKSINERFDSIKNLLK